MRKDERLSPSPQLKNQRVADGAVQSSQSEITLDFDVAPLPEFGDYQVENIPSWRRNAEQGLFAEALSDLDSSGGFEAAFTDASSEELMLLADIARFSGLRDRAVQALRLLTQNYY